MSGKRMTDAQRTAVEQVKGNLAICAGAGSGKTTVLAHRFAAAMRSAHDDDWTPADVDQILTITFTKKAAGEISERVRRVVNGEVSRQAGRRVGEAWISTFHTFCGRLVRRHLLEADVEPGFAQLDEVGAVAIGVQAFEAACAAAYETDHELRRLLDGWGATGLREVVSAAHENIRSMGLDPGEVTVPNDTGRLAVLLDDSLKAAAAYSGELAECKQSAAVVECAAGLQSWRDAMTTCPTDVGMCTRILEHSAGGDTKGRKATQARDAYRAARKALASATAAAADPGPFKALERLLRDYAQQYASIKRQRTALDFDDLQEGAVDLLTRHPEVAAQYRSRFRMLMVDEFQDTNDLQMRVLDPLRHDNLCIVGDERQSIYGFRYADVKVFERVRTQLGNTIELAENFRSHPALMDVVNAAFSMRHLFGAGFMKLGSGRTGGWRLELPDDAPRVECILVDLEDANIETARNAEAERIAQRVAELLSQPGVNGEDVAILLRAGGRSAVYARALERHGVPVLVSAGMSLYEARETGEVLSLLRAIAVPTDDEALLRVLGGRFVALSDDALLAIRFATPTKRAIWDGLKAIAEDGPCQIEFPAADRAEAAHAYLVLDTFGREQGRFGLAELLHRACEEFDYDLTLFAQGPEGVRAWANVLKVARAADLFEESGSGDLAAFVTYLGNRQDSAKDKAAATDAGKDAVRIMTIHAAKGLEFPIVFVADLAARKSRPCDNLLVGRATIDGREVPVVGVSTPKDSFGGAVTATHLQMSPGVLVAAIEEEKRCLYVAATRAEELLVVSGATKLGKPASEGGALIDWVREALGDPDTSGPLTVGQSPVAVYVVDPGDVCPERRAEDPEGSVPPFATPMPSARRSTPPGPPPTVSYTALVLHERCPLSYQVKYVLHMGRFDKPSEQAPTGLGSALHEVLEATSAMGASQAALDAACIRFGLNAEQRVRLERAVQAFVGSDVGRRLYEGDRLRREEPLRVRLGETVLVGSIDALSWRGQEAFVVDYKSGKGPEAADAQRRAAYELQARCYALAAFESGARSVEVAFCFVEHEATTITHNFERDRDHEGTRTDIARRIESISVGESRHLRSYDANVCSSCPALGGLCPIDSPPEPVTDRRCAV